MLIFCFLFCLFNQRKQLTKTRQKKEIFPIPDAKLQSIATALPKYEIHQTEVESFARRLFASRSKTFERLSSAYANAGIDRRYSSVPLGWYEQPHGWKDRTKVFVESALDLLEKAGRLAINRAGISLNDIDGIVTVTSTGLAVPRLDALLMERMAFRRDVHRLPIFGLGCGGGVLGLSRTAALAKAQPGTRWLFLVVELCGITFREGDLSKSNIIATALFGDGAAAAVVQADTDGKRLAQWGEYCWPNSLDVMGWEIEDDGLGVQFSRDIPQLVRTQMREATDCFLQKSLLLEEAFEIPSPGLTCARDVLRNFGNMSAATVLFVLEQTLAQQPKGVALMGALGPGFTAGFLILDDD